MVYSEQYFNFYATACSPFFLGLVLKVVAAENECQVSSVAVIVDNSTYSIKYNLTLNNASLCQDVENSKSLMFV